jgi:hypothetical protein
MRTTQIQILKMLGLHFIQLASLSTQRQEKCKIVASLTICLKVLAFTLASFENGLKRLFKIQELPNAAIIIIMVGFFLSFGLISNFFDDESLTYNLFQGVFISLFTGGLLYGVNILIRRRKRQIYSVIKKEI